MKENKFKLPLKIFYDHLFPKYVQVNIDNSFDSRRNPLSLKNIPYVNCCITCGTACNYDPIMHHGTQCEFNEVANRLRRIKEDGFND